MKTIFVLLAVALSSIFLLPPANSRAQNSKAPRTAGFLYRTMCRECHGADGQSNTSKGKLNHARNIADPAWQDEVSDERIFNSIINGRKVRGDMPAFSRRISEAEAESLVTYVRNLKK